MFDPNVFAVLSPCDVEGKALAAFLLEENVKWRSEAPSSIGKKPILDSREPTPVPPSPHEEVITAANSLVLRLDTKLMNPLNQFQFGTHMDFSAPMSSWDFEERRGSAAASSTW